MEKQNIMKPQILEDYALGKAMEESENTGYSNYDKVKDFLKKNK